LQARCHWPDTWGRCTAPLPRSSVVPSSALLTGPLPAVAPPPPRRSSPA
jgi:hypothetical protein